MMQTNDMSDWNDSSDRLWGMGMGGGWELGQSMREDYKRVQETFAVYDGHIHYVDHGVGFTGIYMSQNLHVESEKPNFKNRVEWWLSRTLGVEEQQRCCLRV